MRQRPPQWPLRWQAAGYHRLHRGQRPKKSEERQIPGQQYPKDCGRASGWRGWQDGDTIGAAASKRCPPPAEPGCPHERLGKTAAVSERKREKLCSKLNIGHSNGKQLLNKLNAFGYTEKDVKEALGYKEE